MPITSLTPRPVAPITPAPIASDGSKASPAKAPAVPLYTIAAPERKRAIACAERFYQSDRDGMIAIADMAKGKGSRPNFRNHTGLAREQFAENILRVPPAARQDLLQAFAAHQRAEHRPTSADLYMRGGLSVVGVTALAAIFVPAVRAVLAPLGVLAGAALMNYSLSERKNDQKPRNLQRKERLEQTWEALRVKALPIFEVTPVTPAIARTRLGLKEPVAPIPAVPGREAEDWHVLKSALVGGVCRLGIALPVAFSLMLSVGLSGSLAGFLASAVANPMLTLAGGFFVVVGGVMAFNAVIDAINIVSFVSKDHTGPIRSKCWQYEVYERHRVSEHPTGMFRRRGSFLRDN